MEEVSRKDDLREDVPKAETLVEKRSPEERSLKQNSLENGGLLVPPCQCRGP